MRLRNKKTGEIIELLAKPSFVKRNDDFLQSEVNTFNSLAELNEEWEDYEDRLEHYYILHDGDVVRMSELVSSDLRKDNIEIGNYFESKEEAKKVVEKLKAWKRLKDNGYKFNGIGVEYDGYKIYLKCDIMKKEHYTPTQDHKDLDLLFGGEE